MGTKKADGWSAFGAAQVVERSKIPPNGAIPVRPGVPETSANREFQVQFAASAVRNRDFKTRSPGIVVLSGNETDGSLVRIFALISTRRSDTRQTHELVRAVRRAGTWPRNPGDGNVMIANRRTIVFFVAGDLAASFHICDSKTRTTTADRFKCYRRASHRISVQGHSARRLYSHSCRITPNRSNRPWQTALWQGDFKA